MYEEFYNFSGNPFKLTPNPDFFYPSRIHKKVMAYLQYGVQQGDGFIVVTGNVGTGKTTIIQTLTNELKNENDIILSQITSTQLNEGELIRMVAASFGLPINKQSKAALLNNLESFLRKMAREKKRVLLIVDEAQNMPKRSLEELRMLSNYQEQGKPLFQSFLVGQQQFKNIINRADMEQLKQRVIGSYHLEPLDKYDTQKYIEYRLEHVGWQHDPEIENNVYERIYQFSEGVPRRINVLCGRLILHAAIEELHVITQQTVNDVIEEFNEENLPPQRGSNRLTAKSKLLKQSTANEDSKVVSLEKRVRGLERKLKRIEDTINTLIDDYEL